MRKLAEHSLETPGMYLIALRSHLSRGKAAVGELLEDVAEALPHSVKASREAGSSAD